MFDKEIYDRIFNATTKNDATEYDVFLALAEEFGEISRAIRAEDTHKNKQISESSRVEIIDLCLVAIELFILRGGTLTEAQVIANQKLIKWEILLKNG